MFKCFFVTLFQNGRGNDDVDLALTEIPDRLIQLGTLFSGLESNITL